MNLIKKFQSTRKKNKKESSLMTGPLAGKIAFFFLSCYLCFILKKNYTNDRSSIWKYVDSVTETWDLLALTRILTN